MKYYVRTTLERKLDESFNQIEYELLIDKEHKPVESFIQQLKIISNEDAVLLEDDIILCYNFKKRIEEVIKQYPNDIINFFYRPDDYFSSHYTDQFSWNQCTYYPKGIGKVIAEAMENYKLRFPKLKLQYDLLENTALKQLHIPIYVYRPCLVQHIDYSSLIQEKGLRYRRTPYYISYLEELGIDYKNAYKEENLKKLQRYRDEYFRNREH